MLLDLHAHYPMHVIPRARRGTHAQVERWKKARFRALVVRLLSRLFNYQGPGDEPAVTLDLMRRGNVGVILSVLYCPFDEIDLRKRYGAPPQANYFSDLVEQLEDVEADIAAHRHAGANVTIAHTRAELNEAIATGTPTLVHAVEGGFHLGATEREVCENVAVLARRGVLYVTVAHLFWRQVATNAPALPFMPDRLYRCVFRQSRDEGLTPLGEAVVRAMAAHGILVDITHMSEPAIAQTFRILDEIGGRDRIPVLATHGAYRFGHLAYNLSERTVQAVARRGGVIGLILCEHYISDGWDKPRSFKDSFALVRTHIDRIREITGSHDHVAFGSDLDGYIKPALPGLEHLGHMRRLRDALADHYDEAAVKGFASGNALGVINAAWQVSVDTLRNL
ncbi:MAG TPA: membrane dipeptidase [Solirubrobacteraceae bacterium]|nr:membrane dipeptidase [Solirubrobacteraceae bacterium]